MGMYGFGLLSLPWLHYQAKRSMCSGLVEFTMQDVSVISEPQLYPCKHSFSHVILSLRNIQD